MANKLWSALQKGAYSGATSYTVGDFVTYQGSSYTCILNTTNNLPTNTTYWALVSSVGATGAAGSNGTNGTNGTNGAAATIAVGTVSTGAAGSAATVANSGTSTAAVFDFSIPQGITGATGATGSPGTNGTSFTWLGAWNSVTAYAVNDVVQDNGSSYIAINANTNSEPPSANWELVAQKGANGTGTGDMVGPASATDNAVARYDTTTGKLVQNSAVLIADTTGIISGTQGVTFSGSTSGTTALVPTAVAGTTTLTLPAATDTLVGKDTTDTLTNKTLTAPKFADLGYVADANANKMLVFDSNTSAVNYVRISNGATTFSPTIYADGTDTNVYLNLQAKGTGVVIIQDGAVPTKTVGFTLSGASAVTSTNLVFSQTTARTITFPDATDTLVGKATTDTLTNKTLTTPTITKPVMDATNPSAQTYTPSAAGTATLDLSLANEHRITMPAGNITIALSNATNAQKFIVSVTQDGTGSRTVTWFSTIRWAGGSAPTLTATANKRDTFGFIRTGSNTYDGFVIGQNI